MLSTSWHFTHFHLPGTSTDGKKWDQNTDLPMSKAGPRVPSAIPSCITTLGRQKLCLPSCLLCGRRCVRPTSHCSIINSDHGVRPRSQSSLSLCRMLLLGDKPSSKGSLDMVCSWMENTEDWTRRWAGFLGVIFSFAGEGVQGRALEWDKKPPL